MVLPNRRLQCLDPGPRPILITHGPYQCSSNPVLQKTILRHSVTLPVLLEILRWMWVLFIVLCVVPIRRGRGPDSSIPSRLRPWGLFIGEDGVTQVSSCRFLISVSWGTGVNRLKQEKGDCS